MVGTWSVIIFSWLVMRLLRDVVEDKSHMGMLPQDSYGQRRMQMAPECLGSARMASNFIQGSLVEYMLCVSQKESHQNVKQVICLLKNLSTKLSFSCHIVDAGVRCFVSFSSQRTASS